MKTHLELTDSGTLAPDLRAGLGIQAPSARPAASATLAAGPAVSAGHPVRGRPDKRRDSTQLARSATREPPPRYDASAVPARLVDGQRPSRRPAGPPLELPASTSDEASDSGRGLVLFFVFVAAVLVMVLAVWLAAAVGQWWILIAVFALDLIVTAAVMGVVIWMLADGADPAQADIRSLTPVPGLERDPGGSEHARERAHAA